MLIINLQFQWMCKDKDRTSRKLRELMDKVYMNTRVTSEHSRRPRVVEISRFKADEWAHWGMSVFPIAALELREEGFK